MALKNQKGQSVIEAIFIFNIMLFMFFGMFLFSSFFYMRMIVIHAGNAAINEAIGVAPQGLTANEVQDRMERKAASVLQRTLFASPNTRGATASVVLREQGRNVIANFNIQVSARYGFRMPFMNLPPPFSFTNLENHLLAYELDVDYSWIVN